MYAAVAKLALFTLLLHLHPPLLLGSSDARIEKFHSHSHSHSHSQMGNIDPEQVMFFFLEDLKLGNTIPIYFPTRKLSDALPHVFSKQQADSIPFSVQDLPHLLRRFSFSPDSPEAKAMEETLQSCEQDPIGGEIKTCATSWESMTEFLHTIFGAHTPLTSVSTTPLKDGSQLGDSIHKYAILSIQQIPSPKIVACHTAPYAYTVFYCHSQGEGRVYSVALKGEINDEVVQAVALCHMDTSIWPSTHVSFRILGSQPGSPVCHFFPADHFIWIPAA